MPQIQLKFILHFAAFSETIDLPLSSTISDLKSLIWEYFQLPIEKQLLRLRNKDLDIRITDSFPLNFYDLDSQALIVVESPDNFKERMLFKCLLQEREDCLMCMRHQKSKAFLPIY